MDRSKSGADAAPISWGKPGKNLRLGVAVDGGEVELCLQNTGPARLEVLSHVDAIGEKHLDWYTLSLEAQNGQTRELRLSDNRNRSAVIRASLDPQATIQHRVDVAAWATRSANGGQPLAAGTYQLSATYDVEPSGDHWSGKLHAGPVPLTL